MVPMNRQDALQQKVFISHASEDKDEIARTLAEALIAAGFQVWFDEYSLCLGDSLKQKIDEGLAQTDFGIVVLSHAFFAKRWPREELDGLVSVETSRNRKCILPIWHKLTFNDVAQYSPTLAAKVGVCTSKGIAEIVRLIIRSINQTAAFVSRNDLQRRTIHIPRRTAAGGSYARVATSSADLRSFNFEVLKVQKVSWEEFGQDLLAELRRLDREDDKHITKDSENTTEGHNKSIGGEEE